MALRDPGRLFQFFYDACQAILASRSVQETLRLIVKRTVLALDAKAGSLWLVNKETHRLELVASHLLSRTYREKGPLSADKSMPEVLEGKTIVIKDAFDDPRVQYGAAMRAEGINTVLAVPVIAREEVVGVLRIYTREPRDFAEEELEFASAIAEVGGLAVANAKTRESEGVRLSTLLAEVGVELPPEKRGVKQSFKSFALRRGAPIPSLGHFRALHEVTRAVLSTTDSRRVVDLIIGRVRSLMKVKGVSLRLVSQTTGELRLVASKGLSERFLGKGPVHSDRSVREALDGVPVLISDIATDPRVEYPADLGQEGIASLLSVPVIAGDRVIGVVRLYSEQRRDYDRTEIAFLSALAGVAGIAIANAKLYEEIRNDLSFWQATLKYFDV